LAFSISFSISAHVGPFVILKRLVAEKKQPATTTVCSQNRIKVFIRDASLQGAQFLFLDNKENTPGTGENFQKAVSRVDLFD
jgi:hypothetical protein